MTTAVQHRRGTTAEHSTFTGLEGEVTIDTTKDTAVIHDGSLAGGYPLAKETLANVNPSTLSAITGAATASDDLFLMYDTSALAMKKISRAELNNAITIEALDTVDINGGTIDGTTIGGTTAAAGSFTTLSATGNVTVGGTVDGRDVAADGSKLDGIESGADVTDTTNVTAAGALMDSELTNITAVKALNQGVATTDEPTWDGVNLNAISASISDTAVDVFVYDTRKDSDGGAWRKRTQHTSWYNETLNTATRGSRREFPAVAVIVAESSQVTIYDGDDPAMPMWMVFNSLASWTGGTMVWTNSALSALNGHILIAGSDYGSTNIDFLVDNGYRYHTNTGNGGLFKGNIAQRNEHLGYTNSNNKQIVSNVCNDVAMTVLPNAPIDAATGLPIPTIAVATNGGVSVIKDDGTVVDITTDSTVGTETFAVNFYGDNKLIVGWNTVGSSNRHTYTYDIPTSDTTAGGGFRISKLGDFSTSTGDLNYLGLGYVSDVSEISANGFALRGASGSGLTVVDEDTQTPANGMVNYITSSYQSGWLPGDIKGAWLSDTDATNVNGAELVTNGTFDTDTSGWSAGGGASILQVSGQMSLTASSGGTTDYAYQGISTVAGKRYTVSLDFTKVTGAGTLGISTAPNGGVFGTLGLTSSGTKSITFVAISTTTYINLIYYSASSQSGLFDNISVRLADADRSVNNNGLQVFGTVTKTPVATGADLVAYSGFTSGGYLQQPYNSALDVGTGDFCVAFWIYSTQSGSQNSIVFERSQQNSTNTNRLSIYIDNVNKYVNCVINSSTVNSATAVSGNTWSHVCVRRAGGVVYIYINGRLVNSASATGDISNAANVVVIGTGYNYSSNNGVQGSLSLVRFSATAPTAEQIAKIYEDEKVLFQENAQATLYGSSDAVTALAYDDDTNLLHVGTSAGRSDFQGLRRVANTTTAVGVALSASNGMIVEE